MVEMDSYSDILNWLEVGILGVGLVLNGHIQNGQYPKSIISNIPTE